MSADNWGTCPRCGKHETLREDYEIGIRGGQFEVIYSGRCIYEHRQPGCGFEFRYNYRQAAGSAVTQSGDQT